MRSAVRQILTVNVRKILDVPTYRGLVLQVRGEIVLGCSLNGARLAGGRMTFRGFAEVVARNGCRNDWEKVMLLSGVLRGRWLVVARVAWGVIATLTMGVFVTSNSAYVADILQLGQ